MATFGFFLKNRIIESLIYIDGFDQSNYYARLFDVHSYPTTYLLDQQGKVVAENIRGEELETSLQKLLGLDQQ